MVDFLCGLCVGLCFSFGTEWKGKPGGLYFSKCGAVRTLWSVVKSRNMVRGIFVVAVRLLVDFSVSLCLRAAFPLLFAFLNVPKKGFASVFLDGFQRGLSSLDFGGR